MTTLRQLCRQLFSTPGFTLVAVLTFALGLGANATLYSFVSQILLRPLPFPEPDRVLAVWGKMADGTKETASLPDFADWQQQNRVFTAMAALSRRPMALTGRNEPLRIVGGRVTEGFAAVLGVQPVTGRWFGAPEDRAGGAKVAVLSDEFWQSRFNRAPDAIGQSLTLDGNPHTVIGVMPRHVQVGAKVDVWVPLAMDPAALPRRGDFLTVFARLKPDTTLAQAQAEMDTITARLTQAYPDTNTGWNVELSTLQADLVGPVRTPLLILWAAVGLVLLIACANIANLLIARSFSRARDHAIRLALGASRGRLLRRQILECWLLAALGGTVGVIGSWWAIGALNALLPLRGIASAPVQLDLGALGFTALVALVASTAAGLAPTWLVAKLNPNDTLKSSGYSSTDAGGRQRLRMALVVAELGLSVALLVGAGLMLRSFTRLLRVDPGYNPPGVLTATVQLPRTAYAKPADQLAFQQRALEQIAALPGVTNAAVTDIPYLGGTNYWSFRVQGRPPLGPGQGIDAMFYTVSPDFHRTLGVRLKQGRLFTAQDTETTPRVALVNEAFVRRHFAHENPLGARISFEDDANNNPVWYEIVGVLNDVKQEDMAQPSYAEVNLCSLQRPISRLNFVLRTDGNPAGLAASLRTTLRGLDANLPVYGVLTAEERLQENLGRSRVIAGLLTLFAAVAVALAALGVYGVISFLVTQRQRELGVRLALGAEPSRLVAQVLREGLLLAGLGAALGLALAGSLAGLLRSQLYDLSPFDPLTYVAVPALLLLVALAACWSPARRAAKTDPMIALRSE